MCFSALKPCYCLFAIICFPGSLHIIKAQITILFALQVHSYQWQLTTPNPTPKLLHPMSEWRLNHCLSAFVHPFSWQFAPNTPKTPNTLETPDTPSHSHGHGHRGSRIPPSRLAGHTAAPTGYQSEAPASLHARVSVHQQGQLPPSPHHDDSERVTGQSVSPVDPVRQLHGFLPMAVTRGSFGSNRAREANSQSQTSRVANSQSQTSRVANSQSQTLSSGSTSSRGSESHMSLPLQSPLPLRLPLQLPVPPPVPLQLISPLRLAVRGRAGGRLLVEEREGSNEGSGQAERVGEGGDPGQRDKDEPRDSERKEREGSSGSEESRSENLASSQDEQEHKQEQEQEDVHKHVHGHEYDREHHDNHRMGGRASVMPMRSPEACWSRMEQPFYHTAVSGLRPSSLFLRRLRAYEEMHERCTKPVSYWSDYYYSNRTSGLKQGTDVRSMESCSYSFLIPGQWHGLGNRFMGLISVFVYSLLTNRALVMPDDGVMPSFLCNPFPSSSWLIPAKDFWGIRNDLDQGPQNRAFQEGKHTRGGHVSICWSSTPEDWGFFCADEQSSLSSLHFLLFWVDGYIVPPLYFVPQFETELESLFPDRRIFTHVARYLLHPANYLWDRITRVFKAYLAHHHQRVSLQIRPVDEVGDIVQRVLHCVVNHSQPYLLPPVIPADEWEVMADNPSPQAHDSTPEAHWRLVAVFVTSLNGTHVERLRRHFADNKPKDGSIVSVYGESNEGAEKQDDKDHYEQALVEMWVLSFGDHLVTTDHSTFGYVAAGLSGVDPISLNIVKHGQDDWTTNGRPVCAPGSSQPCCLSTPDKFKCSDGGERAVFTSHPVVKGCPIKRGIMLDLPLLNDIA